MLGILRNALKAAPINDDKRMELTEHLAELRTRIIRSIWFLVIGAIVAYQFFPVLYGALYKPLQKEINTQNQLAIRKSIQSSPIQAPVPLHNPPDVTDYQHLVQYIDQIREHPPQIPPTSLVFRNFHEPFMVRLEIGIIYGFVLVLPLVVWELGGFITPALTPQERKPLRMLLPLSAFLLCCGVTVAYCTMFYAMHWFLSYLADYPPPAVLMQDPNDYIVFFAKMMLAFGIAFQLPVVLMGMAFLGLITSRGLLKNWRMGVVIAVVGGILTPSNDLPSMALMAFPLLALYFASVVLVFIVERSRREATHTPV